MQSSLPEPLSSAPLLQSESVAPTAPSLQGERLRVRRCAARAAYTLSLRRNDASHVGAAERHVAVPL